MTGSASSTQSSPSSENESTQGTSNSAQSGSPGTQGLDGDMAGSSVGARGGTQERGSGIWNSQVLFILKKLYGRPRECHNKIIAQLGECQTLDPKVEGSIFTRGAVLFP